MKKTACALAPVLLLAAAPLLAGTKPGLWEVHVTKTVIDGKDQSAQMAAATGQMQAAMARLSPEQRAQMSAMMGKHGVKLGNEGAIQICITPEMAKRDVPVMDKDGACEPANVKQSGNHMSYTFACTTHGQTTTGSGEATISGDSISTSSDVTTKSAEGTHHIQSDTEMRFVNSNCGDVKPPHGSAKSAVEDLK